MQVVNDTKFLAAFDLDGTLTDAAHRLVHILKRPKDWGLFYAGIGEDKPIVPILRTFQAFQAAGYTCVITSARCVTDAEPMTTEWLTRHGLFPDHIYLRAPGDRRHDYIAKEEYLEDMLKRYGKLPDIAFDDKDSVIDMYRRRGVFVMDAKQAPDPVFAEQAA